MRCDASLVRSLRPRHVTSLGSGGKQLGHEASETGREEGDGEEERARGTRERTEGEDRGREGESARERARMVGVGLPVLQRWLLPRYGRYLAAAVVVLVLRRWVRAHATLSGSVTLTDTETQTCAATGGASSVDLRAARSRATVSAADIQTHRASWRDRQTDARRHTEGVRRSAQQSWRNAVVTLPTGKVLRVVTEKDTTARCVCAHRATERGAADGPTVRGMDDDDCAALEADSSWSGGSIWDSSELLAQILIEKPPQFWQAHPRVLELGAGCGLVSISAAAMDAQYVVATDQIIHMAQHNVEANFPPGSTERKRIDVRPLRWGRAEDMSAVLSLHSGSSSDEDNFAESVNKTGPVTAQRAPYDLILGADCIYNRDSHERLATTVDVVASSGATVLW